MSVQGLAVVPAESGAARRRVEAAGLAMLLADAPLDGPGLLAALHAIMEDGPSLPLGRRARFDTAEAAHAWLAASADRLGPAIARVAGRSEIILSLAAPVPVEADPSASGRSYLRARAEALAERTRREADLERHAERILEGLGEVRRIAAYAGPDQIGLDGSVLAPDAEAAALRACIAERARELPPFVRVRLAGPWPPVTFAALFADERG